MSKQGKPIVVIGSSNMDLVAKAPKIPVVGYKKYLSKGEYYGDDGRVE